MEVNISNAFRIAVELSFRPFKGKYSKITENFQKSSFQFIPFFLERPLLTTLIFSALSVLLIIVLSAAFMILMGVFIFVFMIMLIGGFVFIVVATVMGVILSTVTLLTIIIIGILDAISNRHIFQIVNAV